MTFRDRTTNVDALRSWRGDVEADYIYTTGVAGERFFTELRDTGRILAAHCEACERTYLPPRMYCEKCLGPLSDWRPVRGPATVEAVTIASVDAHGNRPPEPEVWAVLRWRGIHGGLVHRLAVPPKQAKPGLKVHPVLRPAGSRVGNITDILYFAP
ncbi:MAG: nucleic acid-binding protein [Methanobacteriota archaeon]|nr:MAG: nucleic acid-binding protein [Euryarchaeota archaeon]